MGKAIGIFLIATGVGLLVFGVLSLVIQLSAFSGEGPVLISSFFVFGAGIFFLIIGIAVTKRFSGATKNRTASTMKSIEEIEKIFELGDREEEKKAADSSSSNSSSFQKPWIVPTTSVKTSDSRQTESSLKNVVEPTSKKLDGVVSNVGLQKTKSASAVKEKAARVEPGKHDHKPLHDHELKKPPVSKFQNNRHIKLKAVFATQGYEIKQPSFSITQNIDFVISKDYEDCAVFITALALTEETLQDFVSSLGSYVSGLIIVKDLPSNDVISSAKMYNVEIFHISEIQAG